MKVLAAVFLALVIGGCASQSSSSDPIAVSVAGETVEPNAVICKMEKPTGSNRPVKVCRPAPGSLDAEQARRDMRVIQRQSEQLNQPEQ